MADDRKKAIEKMAKEIEKSEASKQKFLKDPSGFAKDFGVTLTKEETMTIGFLSKAKLDTAMRRLISSVGDAGFIFDNNCGCGGDPGTANW